MKKIPFILVLITVIAALSMPVMASAAPNNRLLGAVTLPAELQPSYSANFPIANPNSQNRAVIGNVILQIIAGSLIYAAGPLAVLMIAVGGFRYVISHGDQTQMEAAKNTLMWAIIGLIVIIVSYAIVTNIIRLTSNIGQTGGQTSGQPAGGQQGGPTPSGTSGTPGGGAGQGANPAPAGGGAGANTGA